VHFLWAVLVVGWVPLFLDISLESPSLGFFFLLPGFLIWGLFVFLSGVF
jgi:hypothetical protein